tara:strand:- start:6615 stop:7079 length:465 start_codon:yes stop_codon:yes gene_type:complete
MSSTVERNYDQSSDRDRINEKVIKKSNMSDVVKKYEETKFHTERVVKIFETEYPELSQEFHTIQKEMYEVFAAKHMDYGLNNITLGGDILNNEKDKKFSLTGLAIRLTDKISRLKNLLVNGRNFVKGEGMEDTFIDIANYGIIGLLVGRNKWKK